MHEHVSKRVRMHRKPMSGINKHGKHIIIHSRKGERYARSNWYHGDASQMVTSKQGLMGIGCNHTTTNLLKVSSVASLELERLTWKIKHRSKQT